MASIDPRIEEYFRKKALADAYLADMSRDVAGSFPLSSPLENFIFGVFGVPRGREFYGGKVGELVLLDEQVRANKDQRFAVLSEYRRNQQTLGDDGCFSQKFTMYRSDLEVRLGVSSGDGLDSTKVEITNPTFRDMIKNFGNDDAPREYALVFPVKDTYLVVHGSATRWVPGSSMGFERKQEGTGPFVVPGSGLPHLSGYTGDVLSGFAHTSQIILGDANVDKFLHHSGLDEYVT